MIDAILWKLRTAPVAGPARAVRTLEDRPRAAAWEVERTLARLTAHRRLARDYERDAAVSEAMIRCAAINTITTHRPWRPHYPATTATFSRNQSIFSNAFSLASGASVIVGGP